MAWGKNGTSNTLGSAGDDMDITDLTGKKFNQVMVHAIASSNIRAHATINNDGGSLYAQRQSTNGGADATDVSQTTLTLYMNSNAEDIFSVSHFILISGEEKLMISHIIEQGTAGSGNAPQRRELVGKYVPTDLTNTMDRIDINNNHTGSYDTDSNVTVLGTD